MDTKAYVILGLAITTVGAGSFALGALSRDNGGHSADLPALRDRVDTLEHEVKQLRADIDDDQSDRRAGPSITSAAPRNAGTSRRDRFNAVETPQPGESRALAEALDNPEPEVREKISELVRDEIEIERQERFNERTERMKERTRERVDEFADDNELNEEQRVRLKSLLVSERETAMSWFREARQNGGGFREIREKVQALRAETDEKAAGILGKEQFSSYEEMRQDEGPGRRWGRGATNRNDTDKKKRTRSE